MSVPIIKIKEDGAREHCQGSLLLFLLYDPGRVWLDPAAEVASIHIPSTASDSILDEIGPPYCNAGSI